MNVATVARVGVQVREAVLGVHEAAQQEQPPHAIGEVEQEGVLVATQAAGIT